MKLRFRLASILCRILGHAPVWERITHPLIGGAGGETHELQAKQVVYLLKVCRRCRAEWV